MGPSARCQRNTWEHKLTHSGDFTCSQGPRSPGKPVCERALRRRIPENSHIPEKKGELGESLSSQGDSFWSFWTRKCCALRHVLRAQDRALPGMQWLTSVLIHILQHSQKMNAAHTTEWLFWMFSYLNLTFEYLPDFTSVVYLCVLRHSLHKHLQGSLPPPQPAEWGVRKKQQGSLVKHASEASNGQTLRLWS